jgi:peptidoglycan glycosyltransferase
MSKQIRNLGVFLAVCYMALFLQVNRLTVFDAEELQDHPRNTRTIIRDFSSPRGDIVTADDVLLAESVPSDDRFELQRVYPERTAELFGHITGHFTLQLGTTGVEREYNGYLTGDDIGFSIDRLDELFVDREVVGDVILSMRADVQAAAREGLGDQAGSVVALDPRNGEILALWGFPSYDPNRLASHDFDAASEASSLLSADPAKPTVARSFQDNFFPGSTFKVVTATAGVESGAVSEDEPEYPVTGEYQPQVDGQPSGSPVPNFEGGSCGGTLFEILQASCNSAFAQMGLEDVGPDGLLGMAEAYGFNDEVPIDLPGAQASTFPTEVQGTPLSQNPGIVAQLAIGQNDVRATPLQMALVAAAVANEGRIMTPHVMREVRDDQGDVVEEYEPEVWRTPMSPDTAGLLREGMESVVTDGTASNLAEGLDEFVVGGKTGTAQLAGGQDQSHAWIIGFAGPEGEVPHVAVAVIVEAQPGASEQTGGQVAAPIAADVMEEALAPPDGAGQDGESGDG